MLQVNAVARNIISILENPVYYGLAALADEVAMLEGSQLLDDNPGVSVARVL